MRSISLHLLFPVSAAAVLALVLVAPVAVSQDRDDPVVAGLEAGGTPVGFESSGGGVPLVRSFKVGSATVKATMGSDGSVRMQVISGTLNLKSPDGEPLANLKEGDDIKIDGFLDTKEMFRLIADGDSNTLRLGAIAGASFTNMGTQPVNMTVNNQQFVVGGGGGRQDAAIGKVYDSKAPLTQAQVDALKKGESVVGKVTMPDGKEVYQVVTKNSDGSYSRKLLDENAMTLQEKRAGNALLDTRKVTPVVGQSRIIMLDGCKVEITGTKDGSRIKVLEGGPLTLGTANAKYVGSLPVGSDIEISGLSFPDGDFFTPVKKAVLLLPVTSSFSITNKSDNPLTLGKAGSTLTLGKDGSTTGRQSGYSTTTGISAENLKQFAPGTGVEITNDKGEKIFVQVGDVLDPKTGKPTVTIINKSGHPISLDTFGLGNFVCPPGGGINAPLEGFNLSVSSTGAFQVSMPADSLNQVRNAGPNTNSVLITPNGLLAVQGSNTVGQSRTQAGSTPLSAQNAAGLLGTNLSAQLMGLLNSNSVANNLPPVRQNLNNQNTNQQNNLNFTLTDTSGGSSAFLGYIIKLDTGEIVSGSIPTTTP